MDNNHVKQHTAISELNRIEPVNMNKEIIIALCAGEASGDLLGAHLIDALKQQYDNIRFVGIGGPRMKAAGLISLEEQEPLAVRGYVEVLGSLSEILKIRRNLVDELKKISPHVFVGIDSPNFNLPVAAKLKAAGIPTLHYVSPSVWAWKPERVHKIVKQVNKVLCLFPMEPKLYREAGGLAEYVGHPLAQILPMENSREAVRERLKLNLIAPVFALLPGSRVSEVEYMTPVFLRAAALILRDLPESLFLMPYPSAAVREKLQAFLKQQEFQHLPIRLQAAKTELACMAADVVLVTSGTASLEVALCKRPMVISYKISPLTYSLVKRKIKIPFVGLPNILLNKMVVPELLQHNATPEKLAAAALDWYYHPARAAELEREFVKLHERLKRNTDELAAYQVLTEAGLRLPKPVAEGEDELSGDETDTDNSVNAENGANVESAENTAFRQPESEAVNESAPTPESADSETENANAPAPESPNPEPPPNTAPPNANPTPIPPVESGQLVAVGLVQPETDLPKPSAFRQPESSLIPPPSIVMGNSNIAATVEPVAEAEPPKATETVADVASSEREIQVNELDMSKVKRKSGLFGWLSSVFSSKPEHENQAMQADDVSIMDTESSIVAVSRAEDDESAPAKSAPKKPDVPRLVIEEEEIQAAPAQMSLPKSTVLPQQGKPNIFTKYMTEQDNQAAPAPAEAAPAPATEQATSSESVAPTIQISPVQKQPALKVKVQAVMRSQAETQSVQAAAVTETQPETVNVNPVNVSVATPVVAAPEPVPASNPEVAPQPAPDVSAPPVGALAKYITQASMAWLPDSVKAPTESVTAKAVDDDGVDVTELVNTVEPIVPPEATSAPEVELPVAEEVLAQQKAASEPKISIAPTITIQVAPKKTEPVAEPVLTPTVTLAEPKVETTPVAQTAVASQPIVIELAPKAAPIVDVSEPQISIQAAVAQPAPVAEVVTPVAEPVQVAPVVEVVTPVVEPVQVAPVVEVAEPVQAAPVVETTVEPVQAAPIVEPVAATERPAPALNAAANPSFASVFRRHTLKTEQANSQDEAHNQPETESEEPNQIVLNRSEALGSAPTQAAQPEAPSEDGLPAPSVSNYSSNPNRYNSGIFF